MAKRGKRIEATPELIEAVLSDLARGLTREWACTLNGISHDSWERWEKRPEFAELRARAIGARVKYLIGQLEVEENIARAKSIQWLLERNKSYQNQFAPPAEKFSFTQNNLVLSAAKLEETRRILDATDRLPYRQEHNGVAIATGQKTTFSASKTGMAEPFVHLITSILVTHTVARMTIYPPFRALPTSSKARDVERSRSASICAFRSATFCSAVAMASAPAIKRHGGGSWLAIPMSARASLAGSPDCRPFWAFQNSSCFARRSS
jgi:hypothetical protein